jgi:CDP-glucose 4,6-dehydratase
VSGSRYAGRGALVTGATGFIGSWIARRLIDEGARKVVIPERETLRPISSERCDLIQMDLGDVAAIRHVLNEKGCDMVFHLAARTMAGEVHEDPFEGFEVNVRGTYNLLEACRLARGDGLDVRVIVASTYHVYGRQPTVPIREDAALKPRNPYEASKACADRLAYCYAKTYDMPVAITRLANVYGPGDRSTSRLLPDAAMALALGEAPVIRSDGTQERDYIHVEDAVEAYLAVESSLDDRAHWGKAWNAGAGSPISISELVHRLAVASGRAVEPNVLGTPKPGAEPDRQYLDSSAIHEELGWSPRRDLDDGLAETYAWYAARAA